MLVVELIMIYKQCLCVAVRNIVYLIVMPVCVPSEIAEPF